MRGVVYEPLTQRHRARVACWYLQVWGKHEPNATQALFEQRLASKLAVVALNGSTAIGTAAITVKPSLWGKRYWLSNVYVLPNCRQQGIGKGLVQAAELLAHQQGIKRLRLRTQCLGGGLYRQAGWKVCRGQKHKKIVCMYKCI